MIEWKRCFVGLAILTLAASPPTALLAAATPVPLQVSHNNEPATGSDLLVYQFIGLEAGLVLALQDQNFQNEVWISDGSEAGTHPVSSGCATGSLTFPRFVDLNNEVAYFTAVCPAGFSELWISDGTAAGTHRLTDFGDFSTFPGGNNFAATLGRLMEDGTLIFTASNGISGLELWRSDGTVEGTHLLKDINPGFGDSSPAFFEELGGDFFFSATDPTHGRELWRTDGTESGTILVRDIRPGELGSVALPAQRLGDQLVFVAATDLGQELWITDGTSSGTRLVKDIAAGSFSTGFHSLLSRGETQLFFLASTDFLNPELWRTDGTPEGTFQLTFFGSGNAFPRLNTASTPITFDDRLAVFTDDGIHGAELWTSDGTPEGTRLARDFCPGACDSASLFVWPTSAGVAFSADDGVHGLETWLSDGTAAGTRILEDICPGSCGSGEAFPRDHGGVLHFAADDGIHGRELWRYPGVGGGAERLTDLPFLDPLLGLFKHSFVGNDLLFTAKPPGSNLELWKWDASTGQSSRVKGFSSDSTSPSPPPGGTPPNAPSGLTAAGFPSSAVFLTWDDNSGIETAFEIESRSPSTAYELRAVAPENGTFFVIENLLPPLPYSFRVKAVNASGASAYSNEVSAAPLDIVAADECLADGDTLCLLENGTSNRFKVRVHWKDQRSGDNGVGHAVPFDFSEDSGQFWFFDEANIELIVKALDGRTVNGNFWAFYGALSDVEYWITVTDTGTNTNKTYHNVPGDVCGLGDVAAFPGSLAAPASSPAVSFPPAPALPASAIALPGTATGACGPTSTDLCLLDERFRIDVSWRDQRSGDTGVGMAIPGTSDSGFFWFFDSANVELVVKVLDGRTVNGHLWVFYGGLSDVEYTITIEDTGTGALKTYFNEPGNICGRADVTAF